MNSTNQDYRKPSERAARFIMGILGWIKYIVGSPHTLIPHGQSIQHHGRELTDGKSLQFPTILIVEDAPDKAQAFIDAIRSYYDYGSVTIFIAHSHDAAVGYFANEDIRLVIMDADLDDLAGDGITLTQSFLSIKPDLAILANSSSTISNLKLTGSGAVETIGKNTEKLKGWLFVHDSVGKTA